MNWLAKIAAPAVAMLLITGCNPVHFAKIHHELPYQLTCQLRGSPTVPTSQVTIKGSREYGIPSGGRATHNFVVSNAKDRILLEIFDEAGVRPGDRFRLLLQQLVTSTVVSEQNIEIAVPTTHGQRVHYFAFEVVLSPTQTAPIYDLDRMKVQIAKDSPTQPVAGQWQLVFNNYAGRYGRQDITMDLIAQIQNVDPGPIEGCLY